MGRSSIIELSPFEQMWRNVTVQAQQLRHMAVADILRDFMGRQIEESIYPFQSVHHLGLYVGDYHDESEVDALYEFLLLKQTEDEAKVIGRGPSYVAPRHYGTPGWWFSLVLDGQTTVELFTCRYYGPWTNFSASDRISLMSHKAIAVAARDEVLPLLQEFEKVYRVNILTYTENDHAGEVYGHLLNRNNKRVMEVIFSSKKIELL